jgi:CRISPR-associated protein Cas2
MLRVVCYDISDDRARYRMSESLLDFGVRIQESVFECCLDDEAYGRMMETIGKVPLAESDRVRVYQVCQKCVKGAEIYGRGEIASDPDFYLV